MRIATRCFSVLFVAMTLFVVGCSMNKAKPEEVAGRAAKIYYDYLLAGDYESYVDGYYRPDSIPGGYREQLIANAKMFMAQQKEEKNGLVEVRFQRAKLSKDSVSAQAFLLFCYGDSTKEEVVVPMLDVEGNWMMR